MSASSLNPTEVAGLIGKSVDEYFSLRLPTRRDQACIAWLYLYERKSVVEIASLIGISEDRVEQALLPSPVLLDRPTFCTVHGRNYVNVLRESAILDKDPRHLFQMIRVCGWKQRHDRNVADVEQILEMVSTVSEDDLIWLLQQICVLIGRTYRTPFHQECIDRGYVEPCNDVGR